MESFFQGYVTCALWSSTDNRDDSGGEPLDENFGPEDILPKTLARMKSDCEAFREANAENLAVVESHEDGRPEGHCGHDFWLSRNGHGTGFFDRYYGHDARLRKAYRELQDAARACGEFNILPTQEFDEDAGEFPEGTRLAS